ncbi:hypothetical protein [Desmospora activa]|nr:hypothetical protein [Desmospora activa]
MSLRALAVCKEEGDVRSSCRGWERAKLAVAHTGSPLFPALGNFR